MEWKYVARKFKKMIHRVIVENILTYVEEIWTLNFKPKLNKSCGYG